MGFLEVLLIIVGVLVFSIMVIVGVGTYENAKRLETLRREVDEDRSNALEHFVAYNARFKTVERKLRRLDHDV